MYSSRTALQTVPRGMFGRDVVLCVNVPLDLFIDAGYVKWKTFRPSDRTLNGGPVYRRVTTLPRYEPIALFV